MKTSKLKHLYFDFETDQSEGEHKANFGVGQTVCDLCQHETVTNNSKCIQDVGVQNATHSIRKKGNLLVIPVLTHAVFDMSHSKVYIVKRSSVSGSSPMPIKISL